VGTVECPYQSRTASQESRSGVGWCFVKALAVWLIIVVAEILQGVARGLFHSPRIRELRARQIGVFTGSGIILAVAIGFARWIGLRSVCPLPGNGFLWPILILSFEIAFGRLAAGASWERIGSDLNRPVPAGAAPGPFFAASIVARVTWLPTIPAHAPAILRHSWRRISGDFRDSRLSLIEPVREPLTSPMSQPAG
jgi:hypothetical protein